MLITDAHLDLAYNALRGRDVTRPANQQTATDTDGTPSVGLPDLRAGHVDLICATISTEPAPLTPEGRALVGALDRHHIIHDTSHLAEESFWQLLDLTPGPVFASHSNCRAIVPTDRQLSDDMIKALAKRGGVIGINFFDKFLLRPHEHKTRRATLTDLIAHIKHIAALTASTTHIPLSPDLDGGSGPPHLPDE